MADLHERLLAAMDTRGIQTLCGALRAVVERHTPVTYWRPWVGEPPACKECLGPLGDHVAWPCSTIQGIARELGVDGG